MLTSLRTNDKVVHCKINFKKTLIHCSFVYEFSISFRRFKKFESATLAYALKKTSYVLVQPRRDLIYSLHSFKF